MTRARIRPIGASDSAPPLRDDSSWERQYIEGLAANRKLSSNARSEITSTLDRVFKHVPDPRKVDRAARTTGALVGAIQSGKTAAMIGLAARSLDCGFRLVLVLAGLRDDLRTQTALRFSSDLLHRGEEVYPRLDKSRFTHPLGRGHHGPMGNSCWAPHYADDVNHDEAFTSTLAKQLRSGRSALVVAKKNLATLNKLADAIAHSSTRCGAGSLPIFVIDDECDEASVSGTTDAPTPDRVVDVWNRLDQFVTYVGLTATPAANLLQDTGAVLFPGDFVEVIRVPGSSSTQLTVLEPDPDRRYTGGDAFYKYIASHDRDNFLVRPTLSDEEYEGLLGHDAQLEEALIAYFVSGAMRFLSKPDRSFELSERLPSAHTMLAHTDAQVQNHWDLCRRVVSLTRRHGGQDGTVEEDLRPVRPSRRIEAGHLERWLSEEADRWRSWHQSFCDSQRVLLEIDPSRERSAAPSWQDVVAILPTIFRNTKLRVINSDESSSDPPLSFQPVYAENGMQPPSDIYSIVIGGNRLSRGLTIEGLAISYYTRASAVFSEDTTVQRERWFGYRGAHLEYCRLFTHRDLAIRLARFHEHDEDLRAQLAWNVAAGRSPTDSTFRFLRLRDSKPSAKTGRGSEGSIDISGTRLFFGRVQMGSSESEREAAAGNQAMAAKQAERIITSGNELRNERLELVGYILRDCFAREIAEMLEQYRFTFHNPDPNSGIALNLREHYRPASPQFRTTDAGVTPSTDPFLLAAYLRFWAYAFESCIADPASNAYRARDTVSPWIPCPPPSFNCVLRVGSLEPQGDSPFRHRLLNRSVDRDGELGSRWGGRGYGSKGDEWIDIDPPMRDHTTPRLRGVPGLALLHVVSRAAAGRTGDGETYDFDRPCFAAVVPEGGPCIAYVVTT